MNIDFILLDLQTRVVKASARKGITDKNLLEEISRDRIIAEEAIRKIIEDEK